MEDAHAIEMNLDSEKEEESNAFFAVYDGHGGTLSPSLLPFLLSSLIIPTGSTVAKFSGENVHKRLVADDAYKKGQFEVALKNAFLGTDEDIRAGEFWSVSVLLGINSPMSVCPVNDRRFSIFQGSVWVHGCCCFGHSRGPYNLCASPHAKVALFWT